MWGKNWNFEMLIIYEITGKNVGIATACPITGDYDGSGSRCEWNLCEGCLGLQQPRHHVLHCQQLCEQVSRI